jgi:protocatechuate 4,5-dioxygenase alpha subunit
MKEYDDIPGTYVFDAERARQGYALNRFCMSLMSEDNRKRCTVQRFYHVPASNTAVGHLILENAR